MSSGFEKVQNALNSVNNLQETIRKQTGYTPPPYVAHGTNISQEKYKKSAPEVYEGESPETEFVPAFKKRTQNELNTFNNLLPTLTAEELKELESNKPEAPKRVFAIPTKQDDKGNPIFDEKGVPVPQDGSYAFAFKPCSRCIYFLDESNTPLLIGLKDDYDEFEKGKQSGHIYIGKGDSFKPEYDNNGNITELTSTDNMRVMYHIQTTPHGAMQHNVQFVMFNNIEDYERWSEKVRKKEGDFEKYTSSDNYRVTSLQEEILNGRATYINATTKEGNPKISSLTRATTEYYSKFITLNRAR